MFEYKNLRTNTYVQVFEYQSAILTYSGPIALAPWLVAEANSRRHLAPPRCHAGASSVANQ
jgi:hypothetical protein